MHEKHRNHESMVSPHLAKNMFDRPIYFIAFGNVFDPHSCLHVGPSGTFRMEEEKAILLSIHNSYWSLACPFYHVSISWMV